MLPGRVEALVRALGPVGPRAPAETGRVDRIMSATNDSWWDRAARLAVALLVLAVDAVNETGMAAAQESGPLRSAMVASPKPATPAPTPEAGVSSGPPGSTAPVSLPPLPPAIEKAGPSRVPGGGMGSGRPRPEDSLIKGQVIQPIDLANALRLAGARDLDIATARQQVLQSLGDLDQARGLWLPSLFTGPTYYRLDGQVQAINGQVQTVDRGSLFLGTTASLANSFPAAPPGSGFPPLNGLSGVLRFSDAIYGVRVVRRVIAANEAEVQVAINNALLAVSEAYFDLQLAAGTLAIAREAVGNAQDPRGHHGDLRPVRCRAGGRPPPHPHRAPQPAAGHPACRRAVRNRLGQPGPPAAARPADRARPGRAGRDGHPARPRRHPARRPDLPGLAQPTRAGAGTGAGPGGRDAASSRRSSARLSRRWL